MYLFSRTTVLADNDGLAWAADITAHACRASGLEVELWGQVWSPEYGRVVWTAFAPDLATLAAAGDAMNADTAMAAETAKGTGHTNGALDDALMSLVHGEIVPGAPQAEYVTSTRSVCANGRLSEGMATGVELAQQSEKITGVPTMFAANVTGIYGGVGWFSGFPNVADLEAANAALAADTHWAKQVDKASSAFAPDPSTTETLIYRRFA